MRLEFAGVSGKSPLSPHFFWCSSMKSSRSARGLALVVSSTGPQDSARRTLRRISWRCFLSNVARYPSKICPGVERHDRADVFALARDRPAAARSGLAEGGQQRVGGRIAAAQASQVDGLPRLGIASLTDVAREVGGKRRGHRRQVVRGSEDRRVVGVVARPEEDDLGGWRYCGKGRALAVTHRGVRGCVTGFDRVAVHQRNDVDGAAVGSAGSTTTSVCSWAVPP